MRKFLVSLLLAYCVPLMAQSQGPYKITHSYLLGGDGGWDYVIPDPSSHRLYIARDNRVMVIDEQSGKLVGEVAGIHGAHGTAIVEGAGRGFETSSEDKTVVMFDLKTLKVLGRTPAEEDTDAAIYDAPSNRIFTMNGDANSSTVVDASSGKLVKNLALGGKPEYAVSAGDGKVYANIEDTSEIVEIDAKAASVLRRWSTAPCKLPVSLAIDTQRHRLFSGCHSGVLAVSDYQAGKVVATAPIGKGVDSTAYDAETGDIFAASADGTLTIIHQATADQYQVLQTLTTPVGSRNLGFDPSTHKLFVVSAKFGSAPTGHGHPPVVPGTFTLHVIERDQARP